jgi:LemA protein
MRFIAIALLAVASLGLGGCGYNTLQTQDEAVKASWSEVVNQYQRRADLIPNLVNTVKGYAAQEERVLVGVTEARARATSIQVTPELLERPRGAAQVPGRAGRADLGAEEPDRGQRELPAAQVRPELPRPAGAARGHREPDRRGPQSLHRVGAVLQRHGAPVPDQPDGDAVQVHEVKPNFTVENERRSPRRPRSTSAPARHAGSRAGSGAGPAAGPPRRRAGHLSRRRGP